LEPIVWESLAILMLVFLSAVFSGMETALTSLSGMRALQLLEEGSRHKRILTAWIERPNHVLATLLVGNNVVNITASSLATDLDSRVLSGLGLGEARGVGIAVAVGAMTFLVLVFGEVAPKTYAKHNAARFLALSPLILAFDRLVSPITRGLAAITVPLVKRAGGETEGKHAVTEKDIEYLIRAGAENGGLDESKQELLHSAIEFSDTLVREVMVPRPEVQAYDLDDPVEELHGLIRKHQFSRYPVYRDDLDEIVGIFYAKDLMARLLDGKGGVTTVADIEAMLHKPYRVPDSKKIGDLLNEFQAKKVHLAIVVDEYGGTAGIVTMEDLLEELVGEIYDEFDVDEQMVRELSPKRHVVNARIDLYDLEEELGVQLPEDPSYSTLGGYLIAQAGRIPEKGTQIIFEDIQFVVRDRDERRIKTVDVIHLGDAPPRPTRPT